MIARALALWSASGKNTRAPIERPIQSSCIFTMCSGQSTSARSSIRRSAYAVILQHPLPERHADHGMAADVAAPVAHLFVRQHRAELGAPVHRHLGLVGEAHLEELAEDPLGPLHVAGIGGVDLAVPVVREAERLELLAVARDVAGGRHRRVLAGLHRVLLGGQAEGVPAHRVQHVEAAHALVAGEDVGRDVAFGVTDVQAFPGRIGEHVEHVVLGPRGIDLGSERVMLEPMALPLGLEPARLVRHARHGSRRFAGDTGLCRSARTN